MIAKTVARLAKPARSGQVGKHGQGPLRPQIEDFGTAGEHLFEKRDGGYFCTGAQVVRKVQDQADKLDILVKLRWAALREQGTEHVDLGRWINGPVSCRTNRPTHCGGALQVRVQT